jgi:FkbM family methyltransferase
MHVRHLGHHLRIARRVEPGLLYLWRELIRRRFSLRRYRLRATGQTIHLRHRTQDLTGFAEIFVRGNYDFPARIASLLDAVPPPLMAVDLGANIGLFGVRLLAEHPDAHIVAFEPDPQNAEVLRATAASNHSDKWSVVEACAGTANGSVLFQHGHFLESRIAPDGEPVPVADVFPALATANLIKIDIEGAEQAILADDRFRSLGAEVVCLEYHPPHQSADILRLLGAAGYTVEPFAERLPGVGELWAWKAFAPGSRGATSRGLSADVAHDGPGLGQG